MSLASRSLIALRPSTIQSTMKVYTQAMSEGKRAANSVVVRSVLPL
jgi:hypothetical protein